VAAGSHERSTNCQRAGSARSSNIRCSSTPPTIVDTSYRDDYGGGKDCHKVNKHARRCPDYLTLLTYLLTYLLTATAFLLKQLCFERIFIEIVGRTRFCIMNGVWLRILLL